MAIYTSELHTVEVAYTLHMEVHPWIRPNLCYSALSDFHTNDLECILGSSLFTRQHSLILRSLLELH